MIALVIAYLILMSKSRGEVEVPADDVIMHLAFQMAIINKCGGHLDDEEMEMAQKITEIGMADDLRRAYVRMKKEIAELKVNVCNK